MNTALIWGASGGIGSALAQYLSTEGWRVLGIARDTTPLDQLNIPAYAADLSSPSDVAAAVHWAAMETDNVTMWVYAAGEMLGKPLADTSMDEWARLMHANVTGAHLAFTHSLPLLPSGAHLVFTGAYVDRILLPKIGAYAAGKAALDAYAQVLAKELRDRRVTTVRMGAVDTPLWDDAPFKLPRGAKTPDEIAHAILAAHYDGHKGMLDL